MRYSALLSLLLLLAPPCFGAVKVIGTGENMRMDTSGFSPDMKAAYAIMEDKCTHCHSLERTILAVNSGVAPVSGRPFDRKAVVAYGQKMLRKPEAHMSKQEVQAVVNLLTSLVENNAPAKGAR